MNNIKRLRLRDGSRLKNHRFCINLLDSCSKGNLFFLTIKRELDYAIEELAKKENNFKDKVKNLEKMLEQKNEELYKVVTEGVALKSNIERLETLLNKTRLKASLDADKNFKHVEIQVSLNNEAEKLENDYKQLSLNFEKEKNEVNRLSDENQKYQFDILDKDKKIYQCNLNLSKKENEIDMLKREVDYLKQKQNRGNDSDELRRSRVEVNERLKESIEKYNEIFSILKQKDDEILAQQKEINYLTFDSYKCKEKIEEYVEISEQSKLERDALKSKIEVYSQQLDNANEEIKKLRGNCNNNKVTNDVISKKTLEETIEKYRIIIEEYKIKDKEKSDKEIEINRLQNELQKIKENQTETRDSIWLLDDLRESRSKMIDALNENRMLKYEIDTLKKSFTNFNNEVLNVKLLKLNAELEGSKK